MSLDRWTRGRFLKGIGLGALAALGGATSWFAGHDASEAGTPGGPTDVSRRKGHYKPPTTTYPAPSTTPPPPPPTPALLVSLSPDRTSPADLNGPTLANDLYIFTQPDQAVSKVDFFLDGAFFRTEAAAPYDFNGGTSAFATAWDSSSVANGSHTISALWTYTTGLTKTVSATFTIDNTTTPPPPPAIIVDPAAPGFIGARVTGGIPTGAQGYESWLGHPIKYIELFVGTSSWAPIDDPGSMVDFALTYPQWTFTYTIPPFPDGIGANYAALLAGSYDFHHVAFAKAFVDRGFKSPIIRLGHELNGNWFDWSPAPGSESQYVSGYKHVIDIYRAQGLTPTLNWNTSNGAGTTLTSVYPDAALMYPGDGYVDIVSQDIYDRFFNTPNDITTRFNSYLNRVRGLNWAANFARSHGKKFAIDEWGVVTNQSGAMGDQPEFITRMHDFLASCEHLLYHIYFDRNPSERHKLTPPEGTADFPNAQARYIVEFG